MHLMDGYFFDNHSACNLAILHLVLFHLLCVMVRSTFGRSLGPVTATVSRVWDFLVDAIARVKRVSLLLSPVLCIPFVLKILAAVVVRRDHVHHTCLALFLGSAGDTLLEICISQRDCARCGGKPPCLFRDFFFFCLASPIKRYHFILSFLVLFYRRAFCLNFLPWNLNIVSAFVFESRCDCIVIAPHGTLKGC